MDAMDVTEKHQRLYTASHYTRYKQTGRKDRERVRPLDPEKKDMALSLIQLLALWGSYKVVKN